MAVDNAYSLVQGGVNVLNVGGVIQKSLRAYYFLPHCNRRLIKRACFNGCRPNKLKKISQQLRKSVIFVSYPAGSGHFCRVFALLMLWRLYFHAMTRS